MTVRQKLQTPYGALMLAHLAGHDGAEMGLALLVIPVTYCKGQRGVDTRRQHRMHKRAATAPRSLIPERETEREREREREREQYPQSWLDAGWLT